VYEARAVLGSLGSIPAVVEVAAASLPVIRSTSVLSAVCSASVARACMARSSVFNLLQACSMGSKSGESGGRGASHGGKEAWPVSRRTCARSRGGVDIPQFGSLGSVHSSARGHGPESRTPKRMARRAVDHAERCGDVPHGTVPQTPVRQVQPLGTRPRLQPQRLLVREQGAPAGALARPRATEAVDPRRPRASSALSRADPRARGSPSCCQTTSCRLLSTSLDTGGGPQARGPAVT
jgi:hypothetical protein